MRKSSFSRTAFLIISLLFCLNLFPVKVLGDVPLKEKYAHSSEVNFDYNQTSKYIYYKSLMETYEEYGYRYKNLSPVSIGIESAKSEKGELPVQEINGRKAFVWDNSIETVSWTVQIETAGLYRIELDYYIYDKDGGKATRALYIDGEIPFYEANNITFRGSWVDSGPPPVNSLGDDVWPSQTFLEKWRTKEFKDSNGHYDDCFLFYLAKGEHTIKLEYLNGDLCIGELRLQEPRTAKSYKEVAAEYSLKGYKPAVSETLYLQAENSVIEKNDTAIRREYDSDPLTVPYSVANRRLNVLGGYRWRQGGQSVTFLINIEKPGLYKLGFRAMQNWNDGLPSYRKIAIDGDVPFSELFAYKFNYSKKWQTVVLSDEKGEPFLFYFDKGQHTVTMTVTVSPYLDIIHSLNSDTIKISSLLSDITKITGSDPDYNYDYKLDKTVPNLISDLKTLIESMDYKYERITGMAEKVPAIANNFLTIKDQLQSMLNNTFTIPRKLDDLNSALTNLGSWYQSLQLQPLMFDSILVGSPDAMWIHKNSSLVSRVWGVLVNFVMSFFKDYNNVGSVLNNDVEVSDTIDVWVSYGSEWAELIKELADMNFTPKTGTMVRLNVLPSGQLNTGSVNALMLSITSGKAPDVALGVAYNAPVELAIRDATYDLSTFEDFEDIKKLFLENIFIPFEYNNGKKKATYALPETMNFTVMYYRKDILSDLKISLPQTREELYDTVLPTLYQNNMDFFFPVDFSMFLYQHGAEYYTADGKYSALDTPEAYRAIKECTELYTNYGIPVSADFYNRFRSGEMPIGIANFNLYVLFSTAAPELAGRWGIAPIPGLKKEDGTIDRSSGGLVGNAAVIMNQTKKADKAWEFLRWWTSTETQTDFSQQLESLIGMEARWASANVEAFKNLAWGKGELEVIEDYWKNAREVPVVLGGYFTSRHLNNAWNRIINDGQSVRDALSIAVYDINRELRAKQEEYGFYE